MTHIIENVNILKNGNLNRTSILVKGSRISLIDSSLKSYHCMRMNGDSFIMTAPHIILNTQIPVNQSFPKQKEYYSKEFIRKGCTTFLTFVGIKYAFELQHKLQQYETSLVNSPIDYVIAVKIPLSLLTADFVRQCKKRKIPAIFVVVDKKEALNHVPWGWIKEAMFPYNCPLIPIFSEEKDSKELIKTRLFWQNVTSKGNIPSIADEIVENQPLSEHILAKIGIYPLKGSIHNGAEISYNFYEKSDEVHQLDPVQLFQEHKQRLLVTVHKGRVIRAGDRVKFQSGFGEALTVYKPSFFSIG